MKHYKIRLDFCGWAGMDEEAAQEVREATAGECSCEKYYRGSKAMGYVLSAKNLNALANAYATVCCASNLKDALASELPEGEGPETWEEAWRLFAEYYTIVK